MGVHEKSLEEIKDKDIIIKNLQEQITNPINLKGNISEMEMTEENRRVNEENIELKSRLVRVESRIKREVSQTEIESQDVKE